MFFDLSWEEQIEKNEESIRQLESARKELSNKMQEFYASFAISPEEIYAYLSKSENFSKGEWALIQALYDESEKELKKKIDSIPNRNALKKKYASLNIGQHWIHVR